MNIRIKRLLVYYLENRFEEMKSDRAKMFILLRLPSVRFRQNCPIILIGAIVLKWRILLLLFPLCWLLCWLTVSKRTPKREQAWKYEYCYIKICRYNIFKIFKLRNVSFTRKTLIPCLDLVILMALFSFISSSYVKFS